MGSGVEPTRSSSNTVFQGFLWKLSDVGIYGGLLTPFPGPLPSLESGE